jgi:hypothetical protein
MPKTYFFTDKAGAVTDALHPIDPGDPRSLVQNNVWNWIWLRRVVYFLTVFATAFVAATPIWVIYAPGFGKAEVGGLVTPIVNAVSSFLPAFLEPWWVAFRNGPGFVLAGGIVALALMFWGGHLQQTIHDVARVAWHSPDSHTPLTGWRASIYKLRRLGIYQAFFYTLSHWILPTVIIFWLFSWLAFGTANTLGLVCKGTGAVELTEATAAQGTGSRQDGARPIVMRTSSVCNPTGVKVTEGKTYRITLTVKEPWQDDKIETDPNGFDFRKASWLQLPGAPYRRLVWSNWFATILRVGGPGLEEHLLQLEPNDGGWSTTFEPRSSGEVFLYVNDAVIGLPWVYGVFYWWNNHGTAEVKLEKIETSASP